MKKLFSVTLTMLASLALSAPLAQADDGTGDAAASGWRAELGDSEASRCDQSGASERFAEWGDPSLYVLIPEGDFEASTEGWILDGASVVEENSPFDPAGGAAALSLQGGESAISPPVCVDYGYDHGRGFGWTTEGTDELRVQVLYRAHDGRLRTVSSKLGVLPSWAPTDTWRMPRHGQLGLHRAGDDESVEVRFRFANPGTGAWLIDDVYVDPRARH